MLVVKDLVAGYAGIPAVDGMSFNVAQGQIVAILGSNGSGKTTALRAITGIIQPMSGTIEYKGKNISNTPIHKVVNLGIGMVPEGRRLFPKMKTYDNLMMGAFSLKDKAVIAKQLKVVYDMFPILEERKNQIAGTMSGGEQQMVAIGRALMCDPELLILDEPSLGLMPILVDQIFSFVQRINKSGVTIIIIEQNAEKTLAFSDYAYVVAKGKVEIEGTGAQLLNNEQVKRIYLGIN